MKKPEFFAMKHPQELADFIEKFNFKLKLNLIVLAEKSGGMSH